MSDRNICIKRLGQSKFFVLTTFLYILFGIGAIVSSILIILPVAAISWNAEYRARRVRWINHCTFSLFIKLGTALGVFKVSFSDESRLRRPGQLIISNHPSLLDVVFLIGHINNTNCVIKNKLLINPFLAIPVYFANYIRNDTGEDFLEKCTASLKCGESLIIFLEGTRTTKGQGFRFKNGAAYLMLMSNCLVCPVHISCVPSALKKNDHWYRIQNCKIRYNFTVLPELILTSIRKADHIRLPIKAKRLIKWLAGWYAIVDADVHRQKRAEVDHITVDLASIGLSGLTTD